VLDQVGGPASLTAAEPGRLQIEPYQLVPLMRALEMPRPRLLLADGVGLGKTVQAGLIIAELIARRRTHRVLVIAPAGPLLVQWQQEMRQRFGLRFTAITGSASLREQQRRTELGSNPFDAIALCLIAMDFAKQEHVLELLERSYWDIVVIDEAHHYMSGGGSQDATLRRRLAQVAAQRSDGLLLLTATPHDGDDERFASLIELLDPSLVDGFGGFAGRAYRRHVVRRLKQHIRDHRTGQPLFRQRRVMPVCIQVRGRDAAPVRAFHQALSGLIAPRLRRAGTGQLGDTLAFISLLKRSVSTIAASVSTLRVVAERYGVMAQSEGTDPALRKERARALRAYRRVALRFGTLDPAAEAAAGELEAEAIAAELHSFNEKDLGRELARLGRQQPNGIARAIAELIRLGEAAMAQDPKLQALLQEVRLIRSAHKDANILVYTEYADSQAAAIQALRGAEGINGGILAISGLDDEQERTAAAERFADECGLILVSTDSMAEGLNLHQHCFHLIHLDLPYNPNRLEQRNGRIDRYGQTRDPQIRYLYLAGTFEERLLLRLIGKYERARARLSLMPDTLGVTAKRPAWESGLATGFAQQQEPLFSEPSPVIRTLDQTAEGAALSAYRDLLHEIDRAFGNFDRSALQHGWMADQGLNADQRQIAAAATVGQEAEDAMAGIDLPEFVTAAIAAETGTDAMRGRTIRLPADWAAGLDGMPGFDPTRRELRFLRERSRLRDAHGRPAAFIGSIHPVVRQAIQRVRRGESDPGAACDLRISVARAAPGQGLALLLTYSAELHSASRLERQQVIAVLLPESRRPEEIQNADQWLKLAAPEQAIPVDGTWHRHFSHWAPARFAEATDVATRAMQRVADAFAVAQKVCSTGEKEALDLWLKLRADKLCGPPRQRMADLFEPPADEPGWRRPLPAADRLASFAADPENPASRRADAKAALALYASRAADSARRAMLSSPVLRPLGMLMLIPAGQSS
jgi:superfamily II DNA or RNA helicase